MHAIIAAAARGVLAIAVTFILVGETRANPVQLESDAGTIVLTGTVQVIDVPNRLLTVLGPQGYPLVFVVSPDVKHLEKIKVKDTVTITYTQEIATALRKSDAPPATKEQAIVKDEEGGMNMNAPTEAEQDWVEITPKGAAGLTTIEVSDTVAAVNRNKRTITFAGTGGKTRTIVIDPSVPGFDAIEPGDRIVLLITRAVAVDVQIQ
jgi:hypothetical protein